MVLTSHVVRYPQQLTDCLLVSTINGMTEHSASLWEHGPFLISVFTSRVIIVLWSGTHNSSLTAFLCPPWWQNTVLHYGSMVQLRVCFKYCLMDKATVLKTKHGRKRLRWRKWRGNVTIVAAVLLLSIVSDALLICSLSWCSVISHTTSCGVENKECHKLSPILATITCPLIQPPTIRLGLLGLNLKQRMSSGASRNSCRLNTNMDQHHACFSLYFSIFYNDCWESNDECVYSTWGWMGSAKLHIRIRERECSRRKESSIRSSNE